MLTTLALAIAFVQPAYPQGNAASQVVSKMLAYYSSSQTLTGTILYTATDGQGKAQLQTTIQYEKPSKLYIRQVKGGNNPQQWLVTSDGKFFSYDAPGHLLGVKQGSGLVTGQEGSRTTRLVERVNQIDGVLDVGRIYAVAAYGSLGDRSMPLDVAIGRKEDLSHDVLMWMTVESGGKVELNGVQANLIKGKWRPYGDMKANEGFPPGLYEMLITDEGKLLRYQVDQWVGSKNGSEVKLRETWDVDLTVNGTTDSKLFRLVK
jgi:hypothetical protein